MYIIDPALRMLLAVRGRYSKCTIGEIMMAKKGSSSRVTAGLFDRGLTREGITDGTLAERKGDRTSWLLCILSRGSVLGLYCYLDAR